MPVRLIYIGRSPSLDIQESCIACERLELWRRLPNVPLPYSTSSTRGVIYLLVTHPSRQGAYVITSISGFRWP